MLSCETPRMQRRSGSCKGLRMTPRSHRLRGNSGYLDGCCVWSDSLSYDIWWWSDEENQTSLKKGLCGVLTFWAHLGHFFFSLHPLSISGERHPAWQRNHWVESPSELPAPISGILERERDGIVARRRMIEKPSLPIAGQFILQVAQETRDFSLLQFSNPSKIIVPERTENYAKFTFNLRTPAPGETIYTDA